MKPHWFRAKYLLETLVLKAAGQDDNGMDLSFTLGEDKLENKGADSSQWGKKMQNARPTVNSHTNMSTSLGDILHQYLKEARQAKGYGSINHKRLTLIVLTDGIWAGNVSNREAVDDLIVRFVKELEKITGDLRVRPVSIEFVQFGDDPEATYHLRRLDNDLKWHGIP